jgi:hypothetical protein
LLRSPTKPACSTGRHRSFGARLQHQVADCRQCWHARPVRITLVVDADPGAAARIEVNIYKLVHEERPVAEVPPVFRHLALIGRRLSRISSQVMQFVDVFRARR